MDGAGSHTITDRVDAYKATRRRKGCAKQPASLSSSSSTAAGAKNAVMLLNELQPGGLRYDDVTKSGPDHKPIYTANVTIYEQVCGPIDYCHLLAQL